MHKSEVRGKNQSRHAINLCEFFSSSSFHFIRKQAQKECGKGIEN